MKRNIIAWVLAIVKIATFFFIYQDINKKPSLQISEQSFDMGIVQLDDKGQYTVELKNAGNDTLNIKSVTPG